MTPTEWAIFIVFNISINIILQTLAWKIAFKIGEKKRDISIRRKNHDT